MFTYNITKIINKAQTIYMGELICPEYFEIPIEFTIGPGKFNYSGIVDALVVAKYPNDKMQAIINNYLLDSSDELILQEFNEMQEWRKLSKIIAEDILCNYAAS